MALAPVRLAIAAAFCVSVALAALQLGPQGNALSRLEGNLLDLRFAVRGTLTAPDDIVILAIDNRALEQAGAFPLPRSAIANTVEVALEKGAKAIVVDLLLVGDAPDDARLTAALDQPEISLAMSITENGEHPSQDIKSWIEASGFTLVRNSLQPGPNNVLGPDAKFIGQAYLGHVNLRLDEDGALRRIPSAIRLGADGPVLPSLAVVAARLKEMLGADALTLSSGETLFLGELAIPVDQNNMVAVNYFGPRGTIPTVSTSEVRDADLEGKLVFIGATADGYRDNFRTPFDMAFPGVEALATLTANILDQTVLRQDQTTWVLSSLLVVIAGTTVAVVASLSRLFVVVSGAAVIWAGSLAVVQIAFMAHMWLDAVTLLVALGTGTLLGFAARWETHRKRALNLAQYQSPQIVEALASRALPEFHERMQKAAIFFVDLAGFTQRSAVIGPKETGALLNRFQTLTNEAAKRWDGTVLYTAGDGALIVFGLPKPSTTDARRAFDCAMELLNALSNDSVTGGRSHQNPARIGAHFGDVYAAVLGEGGRSTPTVTGDVVNVASRLQNHAKRHGALVSISADFHNEAGLVGLTGWQNLKSLTVEGRSETLDVWVLKTLP